MSTDLPEMINCDSTRDWSDWYAWATPEAATLKHLRRRLRDDFGFRKSGIHAQADWSAGRAMGTRRGDEPDATVATAPLPDDRQAERIAAHRCGWTFQRVLAAAAPGRRTADPR